MTNYFLYHYFYIPVKPSHFPPVFPTACLSTCNLLWIRIVNLKWLSRISEAVKIVDLLFASCLRGLRFWQHSFGWRAWTGHNKYLMIYMLTLKAERVSKIKKKYVKTMSVIRYFCPTRSFCLSLCVCSCRDGVWIFFFLICCVLQVRGV